ARPLRRFSPSVLPLSSPLPLSSLLPVPLFSLSPPCPSLFFLSSLLSLSPLFFPPRSAPLFSSLLSAASPPLFRLSPLSETEALPEVVDGRLDAGLQRDLRRPPAQQLLRARDVGLAPRRIVLGQRRLHQLALRAHQAAGQLRQLAHRRLARVA